VVIVAAVILDAWRHYLSGRNFLFLKRCFSRS
jgi:hypothetical protein